MKADKPKIEEVLSRGVVELLPGKQGLKRIMNKRKIRLYNGIDPTSPRLHIGNAVPLLKLRQFQELGHEVILVIGTFTARIGDPAGHEEARKPLSPEQIEKNIKTYKKQASKVLDFSKLRIEHNHEWLSKLSLSDFIRIASNFSVQRIIERDLFQRRLENERPIWMSEFVYPLFQGYDSAHLEVDLELGATEQKFNMLVGREMHKVLDKKEKFVMTLEMIPGLDGRKMSKTFGNTINLEDPPSEMFGKVMSLKDELIPLYFEVCTLVPMKEVKKIEKESKTKPREIKMLLAEKITSLYHGQDKAQKAREEFIRVFQKGKSPEKIKEVEIKKKEMGIMDLLVKLDLTSSKSQAKRMVEQKAVRINGERVKKWRKTVKIEKGMVVQVGKRRFARIV